MKTLERKYSKSERVVAKARFSSWVFLRQLLVALLLGGIIAVLWVYGGKIVDFLNEKKKFQSSSVFLWMYLEGDQTFKRSKVVLTRTLMPIS